MILEGFESKNSLIILSLAKISQQPKKKNNRKNCTIKIIIFFLLIEALKSEIDLIIFFTFNIKYDIIPFGLNKMFNSLLSNLKKRRKYGNFKF